MSKRKDAFSALADPTRRAILELLREEPGMTAGAIAARFPRVSRPAVSKHLSVLRRARLVQAREVGREWHYTIDARPMAEIYVEWLEGFAPLMEKSLSRLKERAELDPDS
ncbi:MAG TPA: metalloregulator ArsR/SmtB family transcription factor [Dehalococcoidia bacterium]|nr:metalloregulator ArsR/SmtB family transcription factor [Dehalococcoidia bacterium]